MSRDAVLAKKLAKYPAEAPACITGAVSSAAGIATFVIAGVSGVNAAAVWVIAAVLTVAGLGFIAYVVRDFVRYRRTPAAVVECREDRLIVLGAEEDCSAVTHVSVKEARGRKGALGWGELVLRSGERQIVCRYVQDVKKAQERVVKFVVAQRRRGENHE